MAKLEQKFKALKTELLGEDYSLSIATIPAKKSRELNRKFRQKDKPTNVLAFPLSPRSGEILLCREVIAKEAANFGKTPGEFFNFLVIHGMLHLKGLRHGAIMERLEALYDKKYFYRNRRRLAYDKSRSGRVSKGRKKS